MIKVLDNFQANVLAMHISGEIEGAEIEKLTPRLNKLIDENENPVVYAEVHDLDVPTARAVWKDLKNIPRYNKLDKCAVVGDKQWLEFVTRLSGALMKPQMKYFSFDEKQEALQWIKS
jgi:hypothetical protein